MMNRPCLKLLLLRVPFMEIVLIQLGHFSGGVTVPAPANAVFFALGDLALG